MESKMITKLFATQDGSAFYFSEKREDVAMSDILDEAAEGADMCQAPRHVWDRFTHDSSDAAKACRAWFATEKFPGVEIEWL